MEILYYFLDRDSGQGQQVMMRTTWTTSTRCLQSFTCVCKAFLTSRGVRKLLKSIQQTCISAFFLKYAVKTTQKRRRCDNNVHTYVCVVKSPHGILEELGQDVIQRQRDEGESSCHVSVDPHSGRVPVLVLAQTPGQHVGNIYSHIQDLNHKLYNIKKSLSGFSLASIRALLPDLRTTRFWLDKA